MKNSEDFIIIQNLDIRELVLQIVHIMSQRNLIDEKFKNTFFYRVVVL